MNSTKRRTLYQNELFLLTSGSYSDYSVDRTYIVLKDNFTLPEHIDDIFLIEAEVNGFIEELNYVEYNNEFGIQDTEYQKKLITKKLEELANYSKEENDVEEEIRQQRMNLKELQEMDYHSEIMKLNNEIKRLEEKRKKMQEDKVKLEKILAKAKIELFLEDDKKENK